MSLNGDPGANDYLLRSALASQPVLKRSARCFDAHCRCRLVLLVVRGSAYFLVSSGRIDEEKRAGEDKSLSHRAALVFYVGLPGMVLLSACSPTEGLLTPTPTNFAAPQDRAPVNSAQPTLHIQRSQSSLRHRPGANCGSPNERALLRVRALAHDEFWIDRYPHRAGFKRSHGRDEAGGN